MNAPLALACAAAGAAYTLTPGPAFLALLGIGARQGRREVAGFLLGHFAGDVLWSTLALLAIVGAHWVGSTVFSVLGLVCGLYLGWLGVGVLRARPAGDGGSAAVVRRPVLRGLAFGLTKPKSYPVALATFTALLGHEAASLGWESLPFLLGCRMRGIPGGRRITGDAGRGGRHAPLIPAPRSAHIAPVRPGVWPSPWPRCAMRRSGSGRFEPARGSGLSSPRGHVQSRYYGIKT